MSTAIRHTKNIILLAFVLVFSACSLVSDRIHQGNTNGNFNNSGIMVEAKDWFYFLNIKDETKLYRFKKNGESVEKYSDSKGVFLNYWDPYLFYVNGDDKKIHQINLNNKMDKVFSDNEVPCLLIANDLVYFIKDDKLFSMDMEAKNEKQMSDQRVMSFNIENDEVYIANDQQELIKLGDEETKVSDKEIRMFNVFGDSVYYKDETDQFLYKMSTNGEHIKRLTQKPVTMFNVTEDWIYYSVNDKETANFMKMKLDGSQNEMINQSNVMLLCVNSDWMHYLDINLSDFQFKSVIMKTDGTNKTEYVNMPTETPVVEIKEVKMNETITMGNYNVEVDSVYRTNILKNKKIEDTSVIFDDVTDNMYVFVNLTFENTSNHKLGVEDLMGLMDTIENQGMRSMSFPLIKEILVKEFDDVDYNRDDFENELLVESQQNKKIQLFFEVSRESPNQYLALINQENEEPTTAVKLEGEVNFVISFEEANQRMMKMFDKDNVVQIGGFGYIFDNETEEKMYYGFEVTKAGASEISYYALERDSGLIYEAAMDEQYPDHPVPIKLYQP